MDKENNSFLERISDNNGFKIKGYETEEEKEILFNSLLEKQKEIYEELLKEKNNSEVQKNN